MRAPSKRCWARPGALGHERRDSDSARSRAGVDALATKPVDFRNYAERMMAMSTTDTPPEGRL